MPSTYSLRHRGQDLRVDVWVDAQEKKFKNRARLVIDGDEQGEGCAEEIGSARLGTDGDRPVVVRWWWTGRVAGVDLVEPGTGDERSRRLPFAPPDGTRAARRHAWAEAHPGLWASRHVVINVGGSLAAIFGVSALISALLGGLLPSINLPNLPDLPAVDWPDWLQYLDPGRYLAPLLGWVPGLLDTLFGWWPDGPWVTFAVGFAIAVAIAVREANRRKKAAAERNTENPT